jgi:Spy/CpxP family protein refolding chaperone
MKKNQLSAFLIAILLFASGAAVGALGHRYYAQTVVSAKDDARQHYLTEMRTKLNLTAAQTTQLERIMDETKAKYKAVHDSNHPIMLNIKHEHIQRVQSILTPQQLPIYAQLVAEHERRAREMEQHDH